MKTVTVTRVIMRILSAQGRTASVVPMMSE
jgi:hypothetical protein